jgi:RNA polymerase sigma-70 factor (ECF subfamily)
MAFRREATTEFLVREAQGGNRQAAEELLERYRPRLLRMIRCRLDPRLKARVDESDVAQETLALANRDLPNYRPQPQVPFYAWLRKIAWRQLLRASRRHVHTQGRTVLKEQQLGWEHSRRALTRQLATNSTPSQQLMGAELEQRVAVALEELSEWDRELLVLRYLERLSTAEIAALLEISPTACRVRLVRALERLRHRLGDIGEELPR